jgi:oligoendopeptidase F
MTDTADALPRWDLSDLYAASDDPKLEADLEALPTQAQAFENSFKGTIDSPDLTPAHLLSALKAYIALLTTEYRALSFASLHFSTNTKDAARGALLQRSREVGSAVGVHLVFFDLEIARMPQAAFDSVRGDDRLTAYGHYLDVQRDQGKYFLAEAEEKVLAATATTRGQAFSRLFTEIQSRSDYRVERDGETSVMSQSQVLPLLYSADRNVRASAAAAITETMKANAHRPR